MPKASQKAKNPESAALEVDEDSLSVLATCSSCGRVYNTEVSEDCPHCFEGSPEEDDPSTQEGVIACGKCGTLFNWNIKGVTPKSFFAEGGLFCPSCETKLAQPGRKRT